VAELVDAKASKALIL